MPTLSTIFSTAQAAPTARKVGRTLSAAVLATSLLVIGSPQALADVPLIEGDNGQLNIGGAMRFRYGWDDGHKPGESRMKIKDADFKTDLNRVRLNGEYGNLIGSVQYHWYSRDENSFSTFQHAWLGWKLGEGSDIRAGVVHVPFGLLPIASQNFWMNANYYLGMEDDPDMGIVWQQQSDGHHFHVGLFAGDEYLTSRRKERYSYDVGGLYREREQLALRYENTSEMGDGELKLGGSLRVGNMEHLNTGDKELHTAAAFHSELKQGGWTTQLQWIYYHYDVPPGINDPYGNIINLTGFIDNFAIASAAHVPTFNVAYSLPNTGWFDAITCYNNYSSVMASGEGLGDTLQNVTGCEITKGKVITYIDVIASRNMYGGNGSGLGIATAGPGSWHSRFNFNIGYYF